MSNQAETVAEAPEKKMKKKKKVVRKVVDEENEDGGLEIEAEVTEGLDGAEKKVSKKKVVKVEDGDDETTMTTTTTKKKVKKSSITGEDGETKVKRRVSKSKQFVVDEGADDPLEVTKSLAEQEAGEVKVKKVKKISKVKQVEEEEDVGEGYGEGEGEDGEDGGEDGSVVKKTIIRRVVKSGGGGDEGEETTVTTTTTTTSGGDGGEEVAGEVVKTRRIVEGGEVVEDGDADGGGEKKVKKVKKVKKIVVVEEEEEEDGGVDKVVVETSEGAEKSTKKVEVKKIEESVELEGDEASGGKVKKSKISSGEVEDVSEAAIKTEKDGGLKKVRTVVTEEADDLEVSALKKGDVVTKEIIEGVKEGAKIEVKDKKEDKIEVTEVKEAKEAKLKVKEEETAGDETEVVSVAEDPLEKPITKRIEEDEKVDESKATRRKIDFDLKDADKEAVKPLSDDSLKTQVDLKDKVGSEDSKSSLDIKEDLPRKYDLGKYGLSEDDGGAYKSKKYVSDEADLDADILGKIKKNKDLKTRLEALETDFEATPSSIEKKKYDFGQNGDLSTDKYDSLIENSKKLLKGYDDDSARTKAFEVDDSLRAYKPSADYDYEKKGKFRYESDIYTEAGKRASDPSLALYSPKVLSAKALIGNQLRLRDDLRSIRQDYGGLDGDIDHIINDIKYRSNKPRYYDNSQQSGGGSGVVHPASHAAALSRKYAPVGGSLTGYTPFSSPFVATGKSHLPSHDPHNLSSLATNHYGIGLSGIGLSGGGGSGGGGLGTSGLSHTSHISSGYDSKHIPSYSSSYGKASPLSSSSSLTSKYGNNPYTYTSSKSSLDSYKPGKSSYKRYNRGISSTPSATKSRFKSSIEY